MCSSTHVLSCLSVSEQDNSHKTAPLSRSEEKHSVKHTATERFEPNLKLKHTAVLNHFLFTIHLQFTVKCVLLTSLVSWTRAAHRNGKLCNRWWWFLGNTWSGQSWPASDDRSRSWESVLYFCFIQPSEMIYNGRNYKKELTVDRRTATVINHCHLPLI